MKIKPCLNGKIVTFRGEHARKNSLEITVVHCARFTSVLSICWHDLLISYHRTDDSRPLSTESARLLTMTRKAPAVVATTMVAVGDQLVSSGEEEEKEIIVWGGRDVT
ncbi:unnamed protein product [Lasius platythorax]|uniref:Uncharacterized protein n=1 Tax=Lasius platythorax TaxID=488582 RepID=A0AAV2PBE0_9HYME